METVAEKECSALGGLFQLIINDLKIGSPVWEDFLGKATKLHSHLKTTVFALAAFLDAFQKIADLATGAKGATKDIGTALTRLCLRHRGVETKLKSFSSTIMDHLVIPLQERLEEWKKVAYQMDKDHAKEYKRVRQEIKKKSSDTLRLQKKVRKAGKEDTKKTLDTAIQDVNNKYHLLHETEKSALRRALIEERGRYCLFVSCLKPVVESELAIAHEAGHLQEVLDALAKLTEDPHSLPSASEQVIADVKSTDSTWSFQTPPSSPTSLGSRKSSMCSISSLNSSSGDSSKSYSPSHQRSRSLSQQLPSGALRLLSVSSQDSGFTSQDTLFTRLPTPPPLEVTNQAIDFSMAAHTAGGSVGLPGAISPAFPPPPSATATWPNLQDTEQFERAAASITKCQRPHTISSAYEHHVRPPLTTQTFQPLQSGIQSRNDIGDSAGTLTSACGDSQGNELQEEMSDGEEEVTPTHKSCTPPLPPRYIEIDRARPRVPHKPHMLRQSCHYSSTTSFEASNDSESSVDPPYANAKDLMRTNSGKQIEQQLKIKDTYEKPSFHEDLALAVAQKALQHQQSRMGKTDFGSSEKQQSSVMSEFLEGETHKVFPPVPPKSAIDKRSFTLPHPHHQKVPVETVKKKPIPEKEPTWNVFSDSSNSSNAHAQLMQALNARLSVLQQQAEEPSNAAPTPPATDKRRFSAVISNTSQLQESPELAPHGASGNVLHRRPATAHVPIRKPRAHSIGGTDREAFLNTLNLKFAQMHQQDQVPPQISPKPPCPPFLAAQSGTQAAPPIGVPKEHPTNTSEVTTPGKEMKQCHRIPPNVEYQHYKSNAPFSANESPSVALQKHPIRQNRRHSLNINQDGGNTVAQFQTFFSPTVNPGLTEDPVQSQRDVVDPSYSMLTDAAARVHSWLAERGSVDVTQCRSSLMGQIRQGINLRKAHTNDRSAPAFHGMRPL